MKAIHLESLVFRDVLPKRFADYEQFLSTRRKNAILGTAKKIKGKRIIHINTAPEGGGVAELLKSLVPLESSVGLKSEWYTITAPPGYFTMTKKIHNALQSSPISLTDKEKAVYKEVNRNIASDLSLLPCADIYVIHDPQPAAVIADFHQGAMISRIHIDLSNPNGEVLAFLKPYFKKYDCIVFSMEEFSIPGIDTKKAFILPAIDPLVRKNMPLGEDACHTILKKFSIHPNKPLISQVSRFDPWKDPIGVLQAFYHAKNEIESLQLILVGPLDVKDDPEALEIFEHVKKNAKGDPDIFLLTDTDDMLINAVQTASDVVLQKSLKEGFGLTVTEAMWKGKAVVAGNVGGIVKQIRSGRDGFLVNTPYEASERIVEILKDEKLKTRLGKSAKARVRDNFLITRHLHDHLKLYAEVIT